MEQTLTVGKIIQLSIDAPPTLKKTLSLFLKKIKKSEQDNNDKVIKMFQKMINTIQKSNGKNTSELEAELKTLTKQVFVLSTKSGMQETINYLKTQIRLLENPNIYILSFSSSEIPKTLLTFIQKQQKKDMKELANDETDKATFIGTMKSERAKQREEILKQLHTIDPIYLFILFGFVDSDKTKEALVQAFDLDDNLFPKNSDLFETINTAVKKTHVTGTTYNTERVQSSENKTFEKLEEEFKSSLNISAFKSVDINILDRYRKMVYEMNTVYNIVKLYNGPTITDDDWKHAMLSLISKFLKEKMTPGAKKAIGKYITRLLYVLSINDTDTIEPMVNGAPITDLEDPDQFGGANDYFDSTEDFCEILGL
jgi:hypothetical protein